MTFKTSITLVAAITSDRGLGKDGQLLVDCPEDMRHFRQVTKNGIVIMGRKTWESLPERFRPLPDRANIVITSSKDQSKFPGAYLAESIDKAKEKAQLLSYCTGQEVFVIGGGAVYEGFKDHITHAIITEYSWTAPSDTKLFELDNTWKRDMSKSRSIVTDEKTINFNYYYRLKA